jgi:hypothetical protein
VPRAVLEADRGVDADRREAHRLVEAHAGGVRERDAGVRDEEALRAHEGEERRGERSPGLYRPALFAGSRPALT